MTTYYHGGRPGIQRGAFLLPPNITKARSCSEFGAASVHRMDRVYITTSLAAAMMFAAGQRGGEVYQVEPLGDIEPDPDCHTPGLSYQVPKARVLRTIRLTNAQKQAAMAMLANAAKAIGVLRRKETTPCPNS